MSDELLTVGALKKYIADNEIPDSWLIGVNVPGEQVDDISTGTHHWGIREEGWGYLEIDVVEAIKEDEEKE